MEVDPGAGCGASGKCGFRGKGVLGIAPGGNRQSWGNPANAGEAVTVRDGFPAMVRETAGRSRPEFTEPRNTLEHAGTLSEHFLKPIRGISWHNATYSHFHSRDRLPTGTPHG